MITAHTSRRARADSREAVSRQVNANRQPKLRISSDTQAQNAVGGGNAANGAKTPTKNGGFVALGISTE